MAQAAVFDDSTVLTHVMAELTIRDIAASTKHNKPALPFPSMDSKATSWFQIVGDRGGYAAQLAAGIPNSDDDMDDGGGAMG